MNKQVFSPKEFRLFDRRNSKMVYENITLTPEVLNSKNDKYLIMQYTGFKDSKEQKIFEGDILSFFLNAEDGNVLINGIIVFSYIFGGFEIFSVFKEMECFFPMGDCKRAGKIGNIFENPELAKGIL